MPLHIDPRRVRLILFTVLILALTVVLFRLAPRVWPGLQLFLVAGLLALALDIPVRWMVRHRMPRWAAVLNTLLILLVLLATAAIYLLPVLVAQSRALLTAMPALWQSAVAQWNRLAQALAPDGSIAPLDTILLDVLRGAGSWLQAASTVFATAVGAVTSGVLVFIITLYLLLDPYPILHGMRGLFPTAWWGTLNRIAANAAEQVRRWVGGILVLSLLVGLLDYLGLALINLVHAPGLPFIVVFAVVGGLLEVVPVVGPIIAAVLPALVGFSIDPMLGVLALLVFFIVQQLENALLVPLVMRRAVKLHPVSLLFSLTVLSALFGPLGAIIATPVAALLKVIRDVWYAPLLRGGDEPPHRAR